MTVRCNLESKKCCPALIQFCAYLCSARRHTLCHQRESMAATDQLACRLSVLSQLVAKNSCWRSLLWAQARQGLFVLDLMYLLACACRYPRARFEFAPMLHPPIPVVASAVGVRNHDLRRAVGQVVAVAVAAHGPVWEVVSLACAVGVLHFAHRARSIASRA